MSLAVAITAVRASASFRRALLTITALYALDSLLPGRGISLVVGMCVSVLLVGYELSVARAVLDGPDALPSFAASVGPILRRGLSGLVIFGVPLFALVGIFILGLGLLRTLGMESLGVHPVLMSTLIVALLVPTFVIMPVQYIADERLSDGFRYGKAGRQFRSHVGDGLRLVGYKLAGTGLLLALRFGLGALFGLDLYYELVPTVGLLMRSSVGGSLAFIAASLLTLVLSALVLLVTGHLAGQYARIAYSGCSASGSV